MPQKDMEETLMHIFKWRKPVWKAIYCMIPTTWHSGKGKSIGSENFRDCQEFEERKGKMSKWSMGYF